MTVSLLVFLMCLKKQTLHSLRLFGYYHVYAKKNLLCDYLKNSDKTTKLVFVPKKTESAVVYVTHRTGLCNSVEHRADKSKLSLAGRVFLNGDKRIRNFSVEIS